MQLIIRAGITAKPWHVVPRRDENSRIAVLCQWYIRVIYSYSNRNSMDLNVHVTSFNEYSSLVNDMLKNWNYQEAQRRITSGQSYKILWLYNISSGIWQLVKLVECWFNGLEPWMGSIAETYVIPMFRCLDIVLLSVRLILILVWVCRFTHYSIWDVITYSFSSFNVGAFQIWEWTSNFVVVQTGFFFNILA